jgi:peptidoglycan hydrolase-like protein with peptidoglycan-binding domain
VIGTRPAKHQLAAASSAGIGAVALAVLLGACANGNAVGIQGQIAAPPSDPVIVTSPTSAAPPVAVTPPSTTTTTTLPTTTAATTTTTTHPTTTIPTTTTTTLPVVKPPFFPVSPVRRGASGDAVKVLQARLLEAGFWLDKVDGHYGWATTQAVMAFQKYYNISDKSGRVDQATANALNYVRTKPKPLSTSGNLLEVDKRRQVVYVIRNGLAVWTLNTSTGSGHPYTAISKKDPTQTLKGDAQTPDGHFKVTRQHAVGWWEGELGKLYRPKYFNGGIAVHGMTNVPNYPASHGCVRVSTIAMDWIWADNILPLGSEVWVHS